MKTAHYTPPAPQLEDPYSVVVDRWLFENGFSEFIDIQIFYPCRFLDSYIWTVKGGMSNEEIARELSVDPKIVEDF